MRPIGAILTYVDILDLFRIVTKCAEEPKNQVHFSQMLGSESGATRTNALEMLC